MGWRENEALERALEGILVLKKTCGRDRCVGLLEDELARERVLKRIDDQANVNIEAERRIAELEERLNTATATLEFYADRDNHEARNGRSSAIQKDKGARARDALEAIGGEESEEGEE